MLYSQVQLAKKHQRISNPLTRSLRVIHGTIPQAIERPAWGIDPGVNFGLTIIERNEVFIFNGALMMDQDPGRYGLIAFRFLQSMIEKFDHVGATLVIEGAAYGAPFRQVELAEIREGFFIAGSIAPTRFCDVRIKPPATVRKGAFGNGKTQAMNEWPLLNHNAADALAIALYAAEVVECPID